jgi:hypothetical protein
MFDDASLCDIPTTKPVAVTLLIFAMYALEVTCGDATTTGGAVYARGNVTVNHAEPFVPPEKTILAVPA